MEIRERVQREIEELHEFFVAWFTGVAVDADFEQGFARRFADDFALVPPSGALTPVSGLGGAIRRGHGSNPEFRIAIRNVQVRLATVDVVVATYEEWQRNALASKPPDNGRVAVVVFRRDGERLEWLHVHETWLPADVMAAGDYDF